MKGQETDTGFWSPGSPDRRAVTVVVLILSLVFLVPIASCAICWFALRGRHYAPTLPQIAGMTGLTLPPSARLVNSHLDQGIDSFLLARVELSAADVEPFLASLPPYARKSRHDRFRCTTAQVPHDDARVSWWNPDSAQTFVAAELGSSRELSGLEGPRVEQVDEGAADGMLGDTYLRPRGNVRLLVDVGDARRAALWLCHWQ